MKQSSYRSFEAKLLNKKEAYGWDQSGEVRSDPQTHLTDIRYLESQPNPNPQNELPETANPDDSEFFST